MKRLAYRKFLYISILFLVILFLLFHLLNFLYPLDTKRLYKPSSTLIYDKNNKLLNIALSEDGFLRIKLKKEEINKETKATLLAYEDRYFYHHFGINPFSILRVLWFNLRHKQVIGASTLTMQLARMMHHQPRTLKHKIIEMFMALQLEYRYDKETILRLYLNNAPYGGNIEGFASAGFAYFHLPIEALSLAQIAYLVSIPQNPNLNRPKYLQRVNTLKDKVLKRAYQQQSLTQEKYERAKQEKVTPKRHNLPHLLPHLSVKLKGKAHIIKTTIESHIQKEVENLIKQRIESLKPLGIYNGSAVVIENKTMEIVAYVGSQDFGDKKHAGEIDGVTALFSPASTLKPFIYAKALEKGLITPLKKLYDVPLSIAGYNPINYSKHFLGEVTATEALQRSLNIPAVELDRLLGDDSLYTLLKEANILSINRHKAYYGSALTLGGCGITLLDLAQLFASLAKGGVYTKASYLQTHKETKSHTILSKEASYLVTQMLVNAPRERYSSSWEYIEGMPSVAFKTGTSAHAKDLLCVGYTPDYTVAVWYGNFDASKRKKSQTLENMPKETGLEVASPSLHAIFKILPQKQKTWFDKPKGIKTQKICQDALEIEGGCQIYIEDEVISNVLPTVPCSLLRAEVLSQMIETKRISSMDALRSHPCYETWKAYNPLITTPTHHQKYTHQKLLPKEFKKIALQCYSYENNNTIYWLIDTMPILKGVSGEKLYHFWE